MATIAYTATRDIRTPQTELITNGDFSVGTGWSLGTGWAIAAGVASATAGTGSNLQQNGVSITTGVDYEITYTVSNRTAGTLTPYIGGTAGTSRNTNDTFTETIECGGTTAVALVKDASFDGDVDDVSVTITDSFTVEFSPADIVIIKEPVKRTHIAMDGSTETVLMRRPNVWQLSTLFMTRAELTSSGWFEFFASVAAGESFTFDAWGTVASPDNAVSCILESDPQYQNDAPVDRWRISFSVRELP